MFVQVENDSDLLFPFLGHASWPTGTGVIMIAVTSEPASLSEYHGGMTTGTHGSESVSHGHGGGTLAGCRDVEVEGRAGPGRGVGGDPAQTTVAHWQAPGLAQAIMIAPRAGQGRGQCLAGRPQPRGGSTVVLTAAWGRTTDFHRVKLRHIFS